MSYLGAGNASLYLKTIADETKTLLPEKMAIHFLAYLSNRYLCACAAEDHREGSHII